MALYADAKKQRHVNKKTMLLTVLFICGLLACIISTATLLHLTNINTLRAMVKEG